VWFFLSQKKRREKSHQTRRERHELSSETAHAHECVCGPVRRQKIAAAGKRNGRRQEDGTIRAFVVSPSEGPGDGKVRCR